MFEVKAKPKNIESILNAILNYPFCFSLL